MSYNIGKKLEQLRKLNNFTLEDVAKKLNVKNQTISKYEKSIIENIPLDKIEALSKIYNVSPQTIVGWNEIQLDVETIYLLEQLDEIDLAEIRGMCKILLKKKKYLLEKEKINLRKKIFLYKQERKSNENF